MQFAKTLKKSKTLTFWEHVYEIRNRVLVVLVFTVITTIISYFLFHNFIEILHNIVGEELYVTDITEGFAARIKVSILMGLFLSIPLLFFETILFIFPALNKKQKILTLVILISTFSLFLFGVILAFKSVLPLSVAFLKSKDFFPENVNRLISYNHFIDFFFQFLIGFGICFQFPLVLIFLLKINILKLKFLIDKFKYFIIAIFIIAAIITPPDVLSQILLAVPMVFLYLLTIGIAFLFRLGR
jgi:sec-independent protein translocase protein TatC